MDPERFATHLYKYWVDKKKVVHSDKNCPQIYRGWFKKGPERQHLDLLAVPEELACKCVQYPSKLLDNERELMKEARLLWKLEDEVQKEEGDAWERTYQASRIGSALKELEWTPDLSALREYREKITAEAEVKKLELEQSIVDAELEEAMLKISKGGRAALVRVPPQTPYDRVDSSEKAYFIAAIRLWKVQGSQLTLVVPEGITNTMRGVLRNWGLTDCIKEFPGRDRKTLETAAALWGEGEFKDAAEAVRAAEILTRA